MCLGVFDVFSCIRSMISNDVSSSINLEILVEVAIHLENETKKIQEIKLNGWLELTRIIEGLYRVC